MTRTSHICLGLFLFAISYKLLGFNPYVAPLVVVGSIFPDLDFKKSVRSLHRKLLHNIWVLILICYCLSYYIGIEYAEAFALGFLSHLLADAMTPMGIYPLYPIERPHIKIRTGIKTGSKAEYAFTSAILILTVLILAL